MTRRLLHEPLLHFVVLGAALFAAYAVVRPPASDRGQIVVSAGQVASLEAQFRAAWQRPPTDTELRGIIDNYVRDEVLYREGVALGLDRDDPVIRNRVKQKVEFLAEDRLAVEPTDADLTAYLAAHQAEFEIPADVTFEQIYFDPARRGPNLDRDMASARAALGQGRRATGLAVGDHTMLPSRMDRAMPADISATFGDAFAKAVAGLPEGAWQGPVRSTFGMHLVRVEHRGTTTMPSLAEARDAVAREWTRARTVLMRDKFYQSLRLRYIVTIEPAAPANGRGAEPAKR